jgi:Mn-dependent DtxR family transcriptional regulator
MRPEQGAPVLGHCRKALLVQGALLIDYMPSHTEENYLKTIYKLAEAEPEQDVSTNRIAAALTTRAASVTDMLRRLADKELLRYEKYRGVQLTPEGISGAKAGLQLG